MKAAIATVYRDLRGWANDKLELLVLLVLIAIVVAGIVALLRTQSSTTAEQIALCMRAFEYTRDQCAFIVRSGVMVRP